MSGCLKEFRDFIGCHFVSMCVSLLEMVTIALGHATIALLFGKLPGLTWG
jgi:hypothetical protein